MQSIGAVLIVGAVVWIALLVAAFRKGLRR